MSDREDFEENFLKCIGSKTLLEKDNAGNYDHEIAISGWESWQAAVEHCKQGEPTFMIIDHDTLWRQVGEAKFNETPDHQRMKLFAHAIPKSEEVYELRAKNAYLLAQLKTNSIPPQPPCDNEHVADGCEKFSTPQPSTDVSELVQPRLTVRLVSFPESNGKRNWTAQIVRVGGFDGLVGTGGGITIAHGELWNRVAYEAERTKYLLGERYTEPHILDYGDDIKTPEEWAGEVHRQAHREMI